MNAVKLSVQRGGIATLRLTRPEKHNAMSDHVIAALRSALAEVRAAAPRAMFLEAEGKSFCAGADLEWMKRAATYTREENAKDAMELSGMLNDLYTLPCPTVALVNGAAIGGGVGMVSACDMAFGTSKAVFGLSEVKLGLLPATISPYVMRRIGEHHCRRYFLTAERFDAAEARRIQLLDDVVEDADALAGLRETMEKHFNGNGPEAMRASKALIAAVQGREIDEALMRDTAERLAEQRDSDECREGITAFFEKRAPGFRAE